MELIDFILALNNNYYSEIVKFFNQSKTIPHVNDIGQKRTMCKKIAEYFSDGENIRDFLRNNFTSESERYFESLILSNPLNTLIKIEGEENFKKIEPFKKCGFVFNIKKDFFAVPDEIFNPLFTYFSKGKKSGEVLEIKQYLTTLPSSEFSYKMSRAYLDPFFHFIKYLYLAIARDLTSSERASNAFDEATKEMRGRFPMLDTIRKFIDFTKILSEIKKNGQISGLFGRIDALADSDWLAVCVEKFIKEALIGEKLDILNGPLKKLKADLYYNLKSYQGPQQELEPIIKSLLCMGVCEVIYSGGQPVYLKLSAFGEKVHSILFPTLETITADINAKKKILRKTALLTPDFKLICENLDIAQYIKILCFADLVSIDNVFNFEINRETILRSIRLGMNYSDFKSMIQKTIKGDAPENVMKSVSEWYFSVVVAAETKCVLIGFSASPERLGEIEKDAHFMQNVIMKVKANQYLVLPEKAEAVRKYFSDRSMPLVVI